tara:strand:- start:33 stop:1070 length:1038 start_codon:yes stop_codon:yes gene_type:complete
MIDIALHTNEMTTMFTLSSLLDKGENFRLHLFTRPRSWDTMQPVHKWALQNFREVHIYQTPWTIKGSLHPKQGHAQIMSRLILQMKEHWKDKSHDMEKVLVLDHTPRIFTQSTLDKGQLPTVAQMGTKIAYVGKQWVYLNHPQFKKYYNILGIEAHDRDMDNSMILLNWDKVDKLDSRNFFKNGRATRQAVQRQQKRSATNDRLLENPGTWHHDTDSFILSATNKDMMSSFFNVGVGYAPTYFNGKVDKLLFLEAMGAKDAINCNIMLRKAYSIEVDFQLMIAPYWNVPTLPFLAMPWDLWAKYIDNIPVNLRWEVTCSNLLDKAERQRKMVESITKAGYLYGKI